MAWLKNRSKRSVIHAAATLLAVLMALLPGWKGITGLTIWLSPFVMLNSVFILKSVVWLNGIAFVVLIASLWKKRWFCHQLCPVGWGCNMVSSCSVRKKFSVRRIPPIGQWLAVLSLMAALVGFPSFALLDPMVVFNGFFTIFSQDITVAVLLSMLGLPVLLALHLLFPGLWCTRLCPLGGMLDMVPRLNRPVGMSRKTGAQNRLFSDNRRRWFLASGTGLAVGLIVPKFLKATGKAPFRPPGSVEANLFNLLCLRCGSCIKTCPSEILFQRSEPGDPMTWMTPEISFKKGYCLENCNLCSQVCPSGAITLFSPKAKGQLPIGLAVVIPDNCLLLKHTECDRCKTACSYKAITIDTKNAFQTLPLVEKNRCIGCGACAVICPPGTIKMIPS